MGRGLLNRFKGDVEIMANGWKTSGVGLYLAKAQLQTSVEEGEGTLSD